MQQDPFFYSASRSYPQNDTSMQFQNIGPYHHMQPNMTPWSPNHVPQNIGTGVNAYSNIDKNTRNAMNHLQTNNIVTPVSTSVYTTTSTFSWAHTVPTFMPWVPNSEENSADPLVRFTGSFPPDPCTSQTATCWELLNNLGANKSNMNVHLKRKTDLEALEYAPQKQCVTEERMAARMKELHISNHYSIPPETMSFGSLLNNNQPEKSATNLQQLEKMLQESDLSSNETKSLILAPEIKKLVAPEKIFASTFLDKVERPSMALVVWQPQKAVIEGVHPSDTSVQQDKGKSSNLSSEANNNVNPEKLSKLCNLQLPFDVPMDPLLHQESSGFGKCSDVNMDT